MNDATSETSPPLNPTPGDLTLTPDRWAIIGPKLESLLAELAKMEDLEHCEVEPDTADAWGATTRTDRGGEVSDER